MACSIKFVRLDDFSSDIDSLDLMANGYSLADDGYLPTSAPDGVKSVNEVITLKLQGTSKDDLADMTQALDEKIKQVGWWLSDPGIERYQVWLRVQLDGETNPRQAQILSIMPPDKVRVFTPEEVMRNYIGQYSIAFERTPFWEGATANEITKSSINDIGGAAALAAVTGDVPARMLRLRIGPHSGSTDISQAWIGFKTSRFGTAANFVPVWGLNNGNYDSDTTASADATAQTGVRLTTTFSLEPTQKKRTQVTAVNASTLYASDQRGTFLVLLRAKMSDTSVARARIAYSFNGTFPAFRSRQVISGTSWKLYEMGTVKNPPNRVYAYHNIGTFEIDLYAERISGAGALHTDCLILIPIDDGGMKVDTGTISLYAGSGNQRAAIFQAANGDTWGLFENGGTEVYYSAQVSPQGPGWGLPVDAGSVIVCAANDYTAGSVKSSTLDVYYTYITRFRTLRGNIT